MKIILNGEEKSKKEIRQILKAVSNKKILKEKGGYVTKASIVNNHLFIGIIPAFIEGWKKYHYDIELEFEDQFSLIGSINADESMTIVFKLDKETYKRGLSKNEQIKLRNNYIKYAHFFIDIGFSGDLKMDEPTKMILKKSGLFEKIPLTLSELTTENIQEKK